MVLDLRSRTVCLGVIVAVSGCAHRAVDEEGSAGTDAGGNAGEIDAAPAGAGTADRARDSAAPADRAAAARDMAPFVSVSCQEAGAFLCEDFESGKLPATLIPNVTNPASLTVDTTNPHPRTGSKYALHMRSVQDVEVVSLANPPPTKPVHFFLRAYQYIASPGFIRAIHFFWLVGTHPDFPNVESWSIEPYDEAWGDPAGKRFPTLFYPGHNAVIAKHPLTFDKWHCWEWEVDGEKNEWRVWVDGVLEIEVLFVNMKKPQIPVPTALAKPAPYFGRELNIGVYGRDDEPVPLEVWYDDVAVASKRIGCPPP